MTRIALYLPSLSGGGAERVLVTLANAFAARGYHVDLVLAEAVGPYLQDVSSEVNVVDLHSSRVLSSIPRLVRYLRQVQPDVVLATLRHANVAASLAHLFARSKARLVLREANHVKASDFSGISGLVSKTMYRWAYRRADAVVGVSAGVSASIADVVQFKCTPVTINNPMDVEAIRRLSEQPVPDEFLSKGDRLVLAVGRLTEQKDYPTLLRAFARAKPDNRTKLVILGEGEERASLVKPAAELQISNSLVMPGFVDNPFAFMRRADAFVLSSRWEGLPNTLIQALVCGAPVIATDCPSGPAEILQGGEWGDLVPVGDVDALAKAISAQLSTGARRDVSARVRDFAVDRVSEQYLSVLLKSE